MKLILASASPRRYDLLKAAGVNPDVRVTDTDETIVHPLSPALTVRTLALRKCRAAREVIGENEYILAADTAVACAGEILGKPTDEADARRMLKRLSGSRHSVLTGCALICGARCVTGVCETVVKYRELEDHEIEEYIASGECYGKAGAYAIQEHGDSFVEYIDGPWDNVVGLPISTTGELLAELGRSLADFE